MIPDNQKILQDMLWYQIQKQQAPMPPSCKHLFQVRKKMLVCCFCKLEREF